MSEVDEVDPTDSIMPVQIMTPEMLAEVEVTAKNLKAAQAINDLTEQIRENGNG